MVAFKWSFFFLLVIFPLFLLTGDYMAHTTLVVDANTATRSAVQAALKSNLVKNSLRDANVIPDNYVVRYNPDTIQTYFDQSLSRKVEQTSDGKGYITVAMGADIAGDEIHSLSGPYPSGVPGFQPGGHNQPPPMLAIRTNVVRKPLLYELLSKFAPVSQFHNIQNEKIGIVEGKK